MTENLVKKAVISDAGVASRYLPVTKGIPKSLLPLLNKSIMDWIILECQEAGIQEIIIVTDSSNVKVYENYYHDVSKRIKDVLQRQNKLERYDTILELFNYPKIIVIPQLDGLPYGSAAPLVSAKNYLDGETAFIFCQGDDVVCGKNKDVGNMIKTFNSNPTVEAVIMTQETPLEELHHYGVVSLKEKSFLDHIVERPEDGKAPSNLVTYGRYLLRPSIFKATTEVMENHMNGEFMLVDTITKLASEKNVLVKKTEGTWLTTGDPLNHIKAQVVFALNNEKYKDEMNIFLKRQIKNLF